MNLWVAILILLLIFFTLSSAFFSLAQISLFSLSKPELKIYRNESNPKKHLIANLMTRPQDLLVTLLFCDILANILVQNTTANLFGSFASWGLKVGVPLIITLLFGEIFPKTIGLINKNSVAELVITPLSIIHRLLKPIRLLITNITSRLSRIIFFFLKREKEISYEELHQVLMTSESQGILNHQETELIDGYLSLQLYTVKELMRPRGEVIYFEISEPISKLTHLFVNLECSKIPICNDDLQNILGIITAKSFFSHREQIKESDDILKYMNQAFYIPETTNARTLLKLFQLKNERIAIVVDEYGSVSGIITLEDLHEIVIGEIVDRRDQKSRYTSAGNDVIIASGKFELSEFEDIFLISLPTKSNVVTIGGWLTEQLGDIPKSGTSFQWKNFLFQVLAADKKRVRRIYIRRLKSSVPSIDN